MSPIPSLLASWFEIHRRDLPWRKLPKNPYHVWISEVMLQQTRVEVVIPYFERFIQQFPSLTHLANAEEGALLKAWEGLGYYSRVRALKKAALALLKSGFDVLPDEYATLVQLPGIGPYTAGAILAFAFQKKGIAIDGNVKRVVSRLYALEYPLDSKELWNEVNRYLDEELLVGENPAFLMEGWIELGALVCTKSPKCHLCPVQRECKAYQEGKVHRLPTIVPKAKVTQLSTPLALVIYITEDGQELVLVVPPKEEGLFKGLSLFPSLQEIEMESRCALPQTGKTEWKKGWIEGDMVLDKRLPKITQTYTRYKETLFPSLYKTRVYRNFKELIWIERKQLETLSMPSGHRKLKEMLISYDIERSP